jgi:Icc-related predicted phosphoesterase
MTILHISDTHGRHRKLKDLPPADVLVHSGDFTMAGTEDEAIEFLEWFIDLPHPHKILIAGNHDDCLRGEAIEGLPDNCHYLDCSGVNIHGVSFYGIPLFMQDLMEGNMESKYEDIPADIDVLITHQPPLGILDDDGSNEYGSAELLARVLDICPKVHLFGHIHNATGIHAGKYTAFSNGSVVDQNYEICKCGNRLVF